MTAHWWDDSQAPTPSLSEFLAAYEGDSNLWWRIDCGHHQNLFESAVDQLDSVRQLLTHARAISPGPGMSIYVADLERALGLDAPRPHKHGMNDHD